MIRLACIVLILPLLAVSFLAGPVWAHKPSDSYLSILGETDDLQLRWDIALRDLDHAIGLDADGDGAITWGEVRRQRDNIAGYALPRLMLRGEAGNCPPKSVDLLVEDHADGAYAVLQAGIACPVRPRWLEIDYNLFFDIDRQHRGLVNVTVGSDAVSAVLGPDSQRMTVEFGVGRSVFFTTYLLDGAEHLLMGADHLLFLLVVLLPIAFRGYRIAPGTEVLETAKILTAFTIAHGLTLSAAVLGVLALPSRPVEVAIALSITVTAIDNIKPFLGGSRWLVAGGFGLIHGLGFAAALGPLDLPPWPLAEALFAFNLGIELAQLGVALIVLPLGWAVRRSLQGTSLVLTRGGSLAALAIAGLWMVDRSFGLEMMPF